MSIHTPIPPIDLTLLHTTRPPISQHFPYTTLFRSIGCSPAVSPRSATARFRPPARGRCAPRRTSRSRSRSTARSEEHTSELQSRLHLVCRLLLEKKKKIIYSERCML